MNVPGQVGRYHITGELGRGGMGAVLRAIDPHLQREVAIKVIAPAADLSQERVQEMAQRFLREARLAARINHPGVVTVYDAGKEEDTLYLVMELVKGETLSRRLTRGEYPDRTESFRIVADAAEALAAAHALGVVHRDVKPSNILLTADGRIKVSDFGVAKAVGEDTDLTRTGGTVGSPAYMAPEQVMGSELDGRADLFSLGVVLYQMLLRRRPFPADTITTLVYQILHHDPLAEETTLRSLGEETAALLRSCLAKNPAERIPDAATFAARARALVGNEIADLAESGPTMPMPLAAAAAAAQVPPPPPPAAVSGTPPVPPPLPPTVSGTAPIVREPEPEARGRHLLLWLLPPLILGLCVIVAALILGHRPPPGGAPGTEPVVAQQDRSPTPQAETPEVVPVSPVQAAPDPPTPALPPETAGGLRAETPLAGRARPAATRTPSPTATPTATATPPPTATPTPTPTPPIVDIFYCSEGAEFDVDPEDAEVAIDGEVIGIADDWDGSRGGQVYHFPGPGTYYARFSLAGYQTAWVKIIVTPMAEDDIIDVDTELEKTKRKKQ